MKVREVPDVGNLSKMAVKLGRNQDMRFSLIAKTPKIRMSTQEFLRGTYDVLDTTGSVPWLHGGPLDSEAKVWDHLDPAFTLDH